jgi:hypothetical protein
MYSSFKFVKILLRAESIVKIRNLNQVYLSQSAKFILQNQLNRSHDLFKHNLNKVKTFNLLNTTNRSISQKDFQNNKTTTSHKSGMWYILSGTVLCLGIAYAGVLCFSWNNV